MQSQRGEPIAKGIKTPYKGIKDYRERIALVLDVRREENRQRTQAAGGNSLGKIAFLSAETGRQDY